MHFSEELSSWVGDGDYIMEAYELIEENSESCPVGATTGGGVPIWILAIVGAVMVVGIVYMGNDKKGEVK